MADTYSNDTAESADDKQDEPAAKQDTVTGGPEHTSHPVGEQQAAENRENDPPG